MGYYVRIKQIERPSGPYLETTNSLYEDTEIDMIITIDTHRNNPLSKVIDYTSDKNWIFFPIY